MKKIEKSIIIFFTYAVIGWIYELFIFYYHGDGWINRGFLYGPYLPVYGFGGLLLVLLLDKILKKKKKNIIDWIINIVTILIAVFIITTLVEYVAHYILDTYFSIKLWDYSKEFLNINGRVCFNASRNFAVGGTALLFLVQPLIEKFTKKNKNLDKISLVLLTIVIVDFIITIFTKYI